MYRVLIKGAQVNRNYLVGNRIWVGRNVSIWIAETKKEN